MRHRGNRSQFKGLTDVERVRVRQSAQTIAEQGLRGDSSDRPHKPGDQGGTYNGNGKGSTMANTGGGADLLARVIHNRVRADAARPTPMRAHSGDRPVWPRGKRA